MSDWQIERSGIRRSAGCIVLARRTGQILIAKRSATSPAPHTWAPWGGKCEYGETTQNAARRELFEETGLKFEGELIHVHHNSVRGHEFDTFLAVVDDEFTPQLSAETEIYAWVPLDDLPRPLHEGFSDLLSSKISAGILYKSVTNLSGRPCQPWNGNGFNSPKGFVGEN